MKKLKAGLVLVLLFLATIVWWGSAEADSLIEIGPSQVGSSLSAGFMLTITERLKDRYDFTLGYISPQEFTTEWNGAKIIDWKVKEQRKVTKASPSRGIHSS